MNKIIFHIKDKQKFHIGSSDGRGIMDYLPSDGLFSALVNAATLLYQPSEVEEIIGNIKSSVCLSSMYFGLRVEDKVQRGKRRDIFFTHKPFARIAGRKDNYGDRKKLKKWSYISEKILDEMLHSFNADTASFEYDLTRHIPCSGKFILHRDELEDLPDGLKNEIPGFKFLETITVPRVTVDRVNKKSDGLFFEEYLEVKTLNRSDITVSPFMYFYIEGEYDKRLKAVFSLLCDEGIGGKRSCGMGCFAGMEIVEKERCFSPGKFYLTLSGVLPLKSELQGQDNGIVSYSLVDKKGYIYSGRGTTVRKPRYRFIKEGSVFKRPFYGSIEKIKADGVEHPVYIYGKSFLVPFGGEEQ